jgi:dienelactone hydrolase
MKKRFFAALFFMPLVLLAAEEKRPADYSLKSLQNYPYKTSSVTIEKLAFKNALQYAYDVSYQSMGLKVSARLSIPAAKGAGLKGMVIMLRGHQDTGGYYTGKGTENPARTYLRHGWAVIAPDFLGFGASSPTPSPEELHQLYSTVNAVELYKSLERPDFRFAPEVPARDRAPLPASFKKIVLWGHSNGGQVAIHVLEVIGEPVPTVLWAPVSLAFPDSQAHYSRNDAWAEQLKRDYPTEDFSLFEHLDAIAPGTPILLEQGDRDYAVPKAWNDRLANAIQAENRRRESQREAPIDLRYEIYPGANHNLNPYWSTVLPRDSAFWEGAPNG